MNLNNNALIYALDLLYPRRCPVCDKITGLKDNGPCKGCYGKLSYVEEPYCLKCGKKVEEGEETCNTCRITVSQYDEGRAVFEYDDAMRKSIYAFKYNNRREYATFYASAAFTKYERKIISWRPQAIIPIPLHRDRLKKRGYNHSYLIAKKLGNLMNIPVIEHGLIRVKNTKPQKNLAATERENNLKNAFKIGYNGVELNSVVLIDDIMTTGSTINEAATCLKCAGVKKVYYIVLSIGRNI